MILADLDDEELRDLAARLRPFLVDPGPAPGDALLTPQEAAQRVGVHVETVRRAVRSGALPARRAGRAVRIHADDLDRWLAGPAPRRERPRRYAARRSGSPFRDALDAL